LLTVPLPSRAAWIGIELRYFWKILHFTDGCSPLLIADKAHKYRDATEPQGEYLLRNRSNCSLEISFNPYNFIMPRLMAKSPQLTTSGRQSEKINSIWAVQTPMPGKDDNFSIIPSSGIFFNSERSNLPQIAASPIPLIYPALRIDRPHF